MLSLFKIGDKIVYGETGVCLVSDICEKEFIKKQKKLYYILKPVLSSGNVIYAPVNECKIPMRNIISKETAEELISSIPDILENSPEIDEQTFLDYKSEIVTHSPQKLVELTARIYNKKKIAQSLKKRLNAVDEKYMKIAENLLFGELAVVLEIELDDVPKYIESKIKSADF